MATFMRSLLLLLFVFDFSADGSDVAVETEHSRILFRNVPLIPATSLQSMMARKPQPHLRATQSLRMAAILSSWKGNEDGEDAVISSASSPNLSGLQTAQLARVSKIRTNATNADVEEAEANAIDAEIDLGEHMIVDAWDVVRNVSLPRGVEGSGPTLSTHERLNKLIQSVGLLEWYLFAIAISIMICLDLLILQHLPENEQASFGSLILWIFIAVSYCIGVSLRLGVKSGISWASGYLLELIFSVENLFIFNLIFHTLETPRRLMRKALFAVLIGSVLLRVAFHIGLAEAMCKLTYLPYILGGWLVYCGTYQISRVGLIDERTSDVTRAPVICILRKCLGDRLGEFYDEDGEAFFLSSGRKVRVTLLGVVVFYLLGIDLLFGFDATLVKSRLVPNSYVSLSSSALALITLRALFFVVRDILCRMSLARYGSGIILLFLGAKMVAARFLEISALMSLIVVANVFVLLALTGALRSHFTGHKSLVSV